MTDLRLLTALDRLLSDRSPVIAAIDGPCATGKTTLGAELSAQYGCPLIHMDDFFLPAQQKTALRLSQPGGNVEFERVRDQVLLPLSRGQATQFRPYCCRDGSFASPVMLSPGPLLLVEGVYALHPALRQFYGFTVFLDAPWPLRRQRLLERGGPALLERFQREWIPLEDRYFTQCRVREACQLVLTAPPAALR